MAKSQYPISGKSLKEMIKRHVKLKELAVSLGLHKNAVSNWISDNSIPFDHFIRIKTELGFQDHEVRAIFAPTLDALGLSRADMDVKDNIKLS